MLSVTHTDKDNVKIAKEAQRDKKPRDSGFMSGTSYVEFFSDEKSKPHTNAKVFLGKTNTHRVQNHL